VKRAFWKIETFAIIFIGENGFTAFNEDLSYSHRLILPDPLEKEKFNEFDESIDF
jgi:hypothetical protein